MGYMNHHTVFSEQGHKAQCNLCGTITDVPPEHFGPIDQFGKRLDGDQRPEYRFGTFDIKLPTKWLATKPVLPTFIFCIDISSTSIINNFFYQTVTSIKQCLDYIPNADQAEICVATFD